MANDKDIGISIPVEAHAVAGSAKKAIGDVVSEANSALKKRYIEVSPETRLSLDKNKFSKEFIKAHEDLFARLDKASAKGFSLSEKELNSLLKKYQRFISVANKEDKGSLPQVEKIKSIVGKSLEPFKEFQSEYKKIATMANKEATKVEKQMTSSLNKKFKLNKDKGVGALSKRLNYPTDTSFNRKGYALTETAHESEYSGHRNPWMQGLAHDMPGIRKKQKLSLKQWKDFKYTPAKGGGRQTTETENDKYQANHALDVLKRIVPNY